MSNPPQPRRPLPFDKTSRIFNNNPKAASTTPSQSPYPSGGGGTGRDSYGQREPSSYYDYYDRDGSSSSAYYSASGSGTYREGSYRDLDRVGGGDYRGRDSYTDPYYDRAHSRSRSYPPPPLDPRSYKDEGHGHGYNYPDRDRKPNLSDGHPERMGYDNRGGSYYGGYEGGRGGGYAGGGKGGGGRRGFGKSGGGGGEKWNPTSAICTSCKYEFPESLFPQNAWKNYTNPRKKKQPRCTNCLDLSKLIKCNECQIKKPEGDFHKRQRTRNQVCKNCRKKNDKRNQLGSDEEDVDDASSGDSEEAEEDGDDGDDDLGSSFDPYDDAHLLPGPDPVPSNDLNGNEESQDQDDDHYDDAVPRPHPLPTTTPMSANLHPQEDNDEPDEADDDPFDTRNIPPGFGLVGTAAGERRREREREREKERGRNRSEALDGAWGQGWNGGGGSSGRHWEGGGGGGARFPSQSHPQPQSQLGLPSSTSLYQQQQQDNDSDYSHQGSNHHPHPQSWERQQGYQGGRRRDVDEGRGSDPNQNWSSLPNSNLNHSSRPLFLPSGTPPDSDSAYPDSAYPHSHHQDHNQGREREESVMRFLDSAFNDAYDTGTGDSDGEGEGKNGGGEHVGGGGGEEEEVKERGDGHAGKGSFDALSRGIKNDGDSSRWDWNSNNPYSNPRPNPNWNEDNKEATDLKRGEIAMMPTGEEPKPDYELGLKTEEGEEDVKAGILAEEEIGRAYYRERTRMGWEDMRSTTGNDYFRSRQTPDSSSGEPKHGIDEARANNQNVERGGDGEDEAGEIMETGQSGFGKSKKIAGGVLGAEDEEKLNNNPLERSTSDFGQRNEGEEVLTTGESRLTGIMRGNWNWRSDRGVVKQEGDGDLGDRGYGAKVGGKRVWEEEEGLEGGSEQQRRKIG